MFLSAKSYTPVLTVTGLLLAAGPGSNFDFSTLSFYVPLLGSSAARTHDVATIPTSNDSTPKNAAQRKSNRTGGQRFRAAPAFILAG